MFLVTFLVLNTADNPRQLDNNVFQASSIAQKYNCQLTRLDFQQEEGLMSCLPLGLNQIEIQRGLTTSSTAIFVPFTTQELFQNGKEALYYGINALSSNLIMVDRKLLKNPNGLILGTPGSGKSFSAKREIANCFLLTTDDVIICDPEAEYAPLVERLHGQVIKISPTSTNYINPMDLNLDYSDDESPLSLKSDFILSLCELIVGGKEGLQPVQKTIIDRCVRLVYQTYLNDPCPENMPILEDLYNLLRAQEEKEAQYIATALEIYVTGSLNVFNHQSNVDINNRIVCYDIKELGKQLKKIGMLVVQDQVWNRVTINRAAHKSTRYYIDEMHLLLKEEQTAAYTVEIWKAQQAGAFVMRHKKGFLAVVAIFLMVCMLLNTMSSCSVLSQGIGSVISGTTYPSDDPELVAVEADYAAKEAALQAKIDNIESSHPGYDEYRYDLAMIGHDPHELAAYLSAVLQGYTQQSAQAELERVFGAQYQLTLTEEVEVRYRTETRTDSEGNSYTVQVPYNYYILNVKLTSKPISSVASELLTPEQLEMYQVYRQTLGNKPLIFGGGSPDMSNSEDLTGVVFVNGTRPGNQAVVDEKP